MKARKLTPGDRQAMLTSFKPLFGDWDYLPLVIDDWLERPSRQTTWLACSGLSEGTLIAMVQVDEVAPGEWFLRGLRSNPDASPLQVASAILTLKRAVKSDLAGRRVDTLRYGTLDNNSESLRLAGMLGFREHFRLGHAWHPLPQVPDVVEGVEAQIPDDVSELAGYLRQSSALKPVEDYIFTWWDTRRFRGEHLAEAANQALLFQAVKNNGRVGAAMFIHVPWQKFLVLSLMEGTNKALRHLYRTGVYAAHRLGCTAIGMVHPSLEEMHRRQKLFSLQPSGCYTVHLIHQRTGE
jgi:hypothetical protein